MLAHIRFFSNNCLARPCYIWPQWTFCCRMFFSLRKFCPHGRFVRRMLCHRTFVPPDVLSAVCFVRPDVLSRRTFCLSGCFVHGRFVSGYFVSGRFVSGRFVWAPLLHVNATCHALSYYSMFMGMQHGPQNIQHGHAAWPFSIGMQYGHAAGTCSMDMQHKHAAWTFSVEMQHGQEHGHYSKIQWFWIFLKIDVRTVLDQKKNSKNIL
jgi:hypothetical protein